MKIVIGLVGEKGSGKETFGNFLMEIAEGKKIKRIRFSDLLNFTLKLWDLPQTRENLQNLAVIMDTNFGNGTLTSAVSKQIQDIEADIVILDGVRWETDEYLIRSFPMNCLVYITADSDLRYKRLKARQEKKNEAKTLDQFVREEKAPNEVLIPIIGNRSEYKIENNGSFEELKEKVLKFYSQFISGKEAY
jgi:dephospho-CoA kinase